MLRLTTLKIGACRAPAWGAGLPGAGFATFPALATLVETESACVLVDCGYGPAFFAATRDFPARLYRWLTPVRLPEGERLPRQLPRLPDRVFLTHMHADHSAGLIDLPAGIPVMASAEAIAALHAPGDLASLRAGCPARLRDAIRARDPQPVEACAQVATGLPEFPQGRDLLGDGRLIAVPLPGHGTGQMGLWLPEAARFLVADAAYGRAPLRANRLPPGPVLARLGDAHAYRRTFARLRALMLRRPDITIDPSHCPEAAR
ncbi:MBL fold metallo-hydrolase [Paracoccus sp. DMF]|uniref:MBL fold metallo-hydrolase n=1 Tax=Paracoccus sp. DMF TaxID=400837 RepID=UPI0021E3B95D|nr:MBL fold metallo-hydrolase [Paracoccus sp. DMF]MCV2445867.1 MBL fold metallo-hydrolase [Paracoccus sp. DMF]